MLNRVPGAIALPAGSANSCAALPTYFGSLSTDNPAGGAFQNVNSENVHQRKSEAMTTLRAPAGLDERCQTCRSTTAPKFLLLATKSRSDGAASLGAMNSVNLVNFAPDAKEKWPAGVPGAASIADPAEFWAKTVLLEVSWLAGFLDSDEQPVRHTRPALVILGQGQALLSGILR